MEFDSLFKAKHIQGKQNVLTIYMFQFTLQEVKSYTTRFDQIPTIVSDGMIHI